MIVVKPAPEVAAAAVHAAPSARADAGLSAGYGAPATAPAAQGGLGGAFNSMFDSSGSAPAPESSSLAGGYDAGSVAPAAPAESNGNGSYANGSGNGGADTAFGFQSSFGSGGGETDIALGSLERAQQPAPSSDRGGERVWYVAIEDAQVGPVNLAEVEERWDAKEIDEDTLVWKAGMADWIPLVDVADLAYMITERPQARISRPAMAAGASVGASSSLQAASFGAPTEMSDEPSWRPSAASALSSLVQEELVAKKAEPEAPSTPKGLEGLGISNLGASDIFGQGAARAGTPITMSSSQTRSQPASEQYDGGSPAWSVPSARRNGMGTGAKVGIAIFVLLAISGLAYGGYTFLQISTQAQQAQATKAEALLKQFQDEKRQAEEERKKRDQELANAPPVAPPIPVIVPPVVAQNDNHASRTKGSHVRDGKDGDDKTEKAPKGDRKGGKDPDPLADIDKAQEVKASLDKSDIVDGVKKNAANLGPCVTAARTKEEIQPGRVQFVLDWVINPNGAVTSPRLKGPQEVMSTSLPSCFARVMGSWKFAPSKQGAPISNFPLPINVH
ncbi:MAG: DUF4339 domain-containing protein [Clostridia bacterium]|nr:DUF4339 domain-containing protein [Deltaproteobacteria bacterium]